MKKHRQFSFVALTILITVFVFGTAFGQNDVELDISADFISRYIWRGLSINDAPNVQPNMSISSGGFEAGFWGSSILTQGNVSDDSHAFSHEIDTWIGYTHTFENSASIGFVVTDYYFPNAGIGIGNFNNHDDVDGPGAHTFEAGLVFEFPEKIPLTLSGYMNIYNDAGNNTYFQLDYAKMVNETELGFFVGATGGSEDNPDYYSAENFNIINIGMQASREIEISDRFSLPIFVNFTLNPLSDTAYMIFGITLH